MPLQKSIGMVSSPKKSRPPVQKKAAVLKLLRTLIILMSRERFKHLNTSLTWSEKKTKSYCNICLLDLLKAPMKKDKLA